MRLAVWISTVFLSLLWSLGIACAQTLPGVALAAQAEEDSAQAKRLRIINADVLTFQKRDDLPVQKLIGRVQMQQDSTFFFCDSAYLYDNENRAEAFGRVRVEMPDSVFLFADRLEYDGESRIAEVYENITLTDQGSVLKTDRLTYYRNEEYGFYQEGGTLEDGESLLKSKLGYYYPNQDRATFRKSVTLVHPDYTLSTDTLDYNTDTKIAYFVTQTFIDSKDGEIETSLGNYDTENSRVNLYERSVVRDSAYTLTADTLYYTDRNNLGLAYGHVKVQQEDSTLELRGQFGRFNRETDESLLTGDAVAIQLFDEDTLYIFADTLFATKETRFRYQKPEPDSSSLDSTQVPSDSLGPLADSTAILADSLRPDTISIAQVVADSVAIDSVVAADTAQVIVGPPTLAEAQPTDTIELRLFKAYPKVRFFMQDMQGRADSMVYFYDDSLINLFDDPVLWSEDNQLSGDTIKIWMKNKEADSMWVGASGFLVSEEDTVGHNQIKGKELRAKFRNNEIVRLHVIGNSESIYFIKDDSDTVTVSYRGMNKAQAQQMMIYFQDNDVKRIVFLAKPEGTFSPMHEVIFQPNRLDGMQWRPSERPVRPDIFPRQAAPAVALPTAEPDPASEPPPATMLQLPEGGQ